MLVTLGTERVKVTIPSHFEHKIHEIDEKWGVKTCPVVRYGWKVPEKGFFQDRRFRHNTVTSLPF